MTHFFENSRKRVYLYLAFLLWTFTTNTLCAQEIIYQPLSRIQRGIWISDTDGRDARQLFNPPLFVYEMSIQKGDRYILCVAEGVAREDGLLGELGMDAYLFDTQQPHKGRKDLTLGRFDRIVDADISKNGEVVFTNIINEQFPDGIYLISSHEIHQPLPKAEKLFSGSARYVDWAPNGEEIVFSNPEGIFLLNVFTKQVSQVIPYGSRPVFSPNGTQLAFLTNTPTPDGQGHFHKIAVVSFPTPAEVKKFDVTKTTSYCSCLTWTPNGGSIAYAINHSPEGHPESLNWTVSVTNGTRQPIFRKFERGLHVWEWTQQNDSGIPSDLLTTTWAGLKVQTYERSEK